MNLLVFVLDTLRADHLSCYGYPRATSPRIDALAEEGILFENAITNTAHTGPTFTTLLTGQYPFTHDVVATLPSQPNERGQVLDDTTPTLAECLRGAGYLTAAFDNLMIWPSHPYWVARGVDYYVHTLNPEREFCAAVLAEHINARLLPWLEANAARRFFLLVHYWDPHQPYNQPEPYRTLHTGAPGHPETPAADGRAYVPQWGWRDRLTPEALEKIDLYDGEITYVDHHVGQVLDALKRLGHYDDTAIVLTADHGEDMEEHNSPFEHREPYEATIHVPLVVKPSGEWPAAAPSRVPAMVGHIDLMPTLLALAGAEPPEGMDGESWLGFLDAPATSLHEELFVTGSILKQRGRWRTPELAVRTAAAKYIRRFDAAFEPTHAMAHVAGLSAPPWRRERGRPLRERVDYFNSLPREELYDLAQDPCETANLIDAHPEQAEGLRAALDRYIATNPTRC